MRKYPQQTRTSKKTLSSVSDNTDLREYESKKVAIDIPLVKEADAPLRSL